MTRWFAEPGPPRSFPGPPLLPQATGPLHQARPEATQSTAIKAEEIHRLAFVRQKWSTVGGNRNWRGEIRRWSVAGSARAGRDDDRQGPPHPGSGPSRPGRRCLNARVAHGPPFRPPSLPRRRVPPPPWQRSHLLWRTRQGPGTGPHRRRGLKRLSRQSPRQWRDPPRPPAHPPGREGACEEQQFSSPARDAEAWCRIHSRSPGAPAQDQSALSPAELPRPPAVVHPRSPV